MPVTPPSALHWVRSDPRTRRPGPVPSAQTSPPWNTWKVPRASVPMAPVGKCSQPLGERACERSVDEAVLLDQRQPVEGARYDRHLKMVAATGAVVDADLALRECLLQQGADRFGGLRR